MTAQTGPSRAANGPRSDQKCVDDPQVGRAAEASPDGQSGPAQSTSPPLGEGAHASRPMACFHPLPAWRTRGGGVNLGREPPDSQALRLPCGSCLGCRLENARAWALRCHLELTQHPAAVFTTLTYANDPKVLFKGDVQRWLKRLRKALDVGTTGPRLKYFLAGEYGERFKRPHYHAIVFGLNAATHADLIERTWGLGFCQTVPVTPAAIAYVAGYCQKKLDWKMTQQVDPSTGEVLWEPPFRLMSRRPGIGGAARSKPQLWREKAVYQGREIPVPRYLHEAWKKGATKEQLEQLELERFKKHALRETLSTEETKLALKAAEANAVARQNLRAARRRYE